jgi:crotonobetainyl-CoA:carnitine CoA-transferase CaiB-like acyl-CoA transferase
MEAFAIAKRHRIPLAPVRDVDEVMRDHHMHERRMLEWIEHDEIGRIVVPTTPLRIHGADPVDTVPSPKLGSSTIARSTATGSVCHPPRSLRSNKIVSSDPDRQPSTASSAN